MVEALEARPPLLLFHNVPLDWRLGRTPGTPTVVTMEKSGYLTEMLLLALARTLHMWPVGYVEEKAGAIIHQVCPVPGHEGEYSNRGSLEFPMHTEMNMVRHHPEWIALLCLRGKQGWSTPVVDMADWFSELTDSQLEVAAQPRFRCPGFGSFEGEEVGGGWLTSLVHAETGAAGLEYSIDLAAWEGVDDQAEEVLTKLRGSVRHHQVYVELRAGDLVLINNRRVAHGRSHSRSCGEVRYDGTQRWLQRMYMVSDLRKSAQVSPFVWSLL